MVNNVDVHIGQMLSNLTMAIVKTSADIEQLQKLFALINKGEREDVDG